MFFDSRDKSLNIISFCRNDQKKIKEQKKNKGSVLVSESAYNAQNAQFGLEMNFSFFFGFFYIYIFAKKLEKS